MYKIYKIVDNTNDDVYIGITTQKLKKRLGQHKCSTCCMSRDIIKNGDYRIELIEETDDKTRERHWIENTECINITVPGRTKKEYDKEWRKNNKEKWLILNKKGARKYRVNNIDKVRDHDRRRNTIKNNWMSSMGGRPSNNNMSLLKIDVNLFS